MSLGLFSVAVVCSWASSTAEAVSQQALLFERQWLHRSAHEQTEPLFYAATQMHGMFQYPRAT